MLAAKYVVDAEKIEHLLLSARAVMDIVELHMERFPARERQKVGIMVEVLSDAMRSLTHDRD